MSDPLRIVREALFEGRAHAASASVEGHDQRWREEHTRVLVEKIDRALSDLPALVDQVREEERAACEAIARRCVEERDRQASHFDQHDERRTWIDLKASEAERIADAIRARAKEGR